MANISSDMLIVQLKSLARSGPRPLDASSIWEDLPSAQSYAKAANAYAGQIITALVDGQYKAYILQGSAGNYTLQEIGTGGSSKQYVKFVDSLPLSDQEEGVLYINTTDNTGSFWNGSDWKLVCKDFSSDIETINTTIEEIQTSLSEKASNNNPVFTGTVTVNGDNVATEQYVEGLISNITTTAPGIVDSSHALPQENYKAGQTWRVAEEGSYAGQDCEVGDLIMCISDYSETYKESDFIVLQANIDGAVTSSADSSIDGDIVVYDGVTGKIIKSSSVNISSLNDAISKAHEHSNKEILDTYNKNQTDLLSEAKTQAQGLVDTLSETVSQKANKATTLEGYGITDAYTTTEVDNIKSTLETSINQKIDSATVDSKISEATAQIEEDYTAAINEKIGNIGGYDTVVEYIDAAVGSGGSDVAGQIAQALQQAKDYTDEKLTVIEF